VSDVKRSRLTACSTATLSEPHAKVRGYAANKKLVGRKRHIAVDTEGRLLMINLTTADISHSAGAQVILGAVRKRWPWLKPLEKAAFQISWQVVRRVDKPEALTCNRDAGLSDAPLAG
jgi:hypothetical protein